MYQYHKRRKTFFPNFIVNIMNWFRCQFNVGFNWGLTEDPVLLHIFVGGVQSKFSAIARCIFVDYPSLLHRSIQL